MRIGLVGLLGIASASGREIVSTGRSTSFIIYTDTPIGFNDKVVQVAGRNNFGQLGTNSGEDKIVDLFDLTPLLRNSVDINENSTVKAIAAGAFHSLLLLDNGDVFSAGRNRYGELGRAGDSRAWGKVNIAPVSAVSAGYAHSVFLMKDGTVMASGRNSAGQLGLGHTEDRSAPEEMKVEANSTYISIAAGYDFTYILQEGGDVYSTGQNLGGQLGVGDRRSRNEPTKMVHPEGHRVSLGKVTQMAAGNSHGVFADDAERLWSVGAAFNGQLGNNWCNGFPNIRKPEFYTEPTHAYRSTGHDNIKLVAAAGDSSCVSTWQLQCFGSNQDGQLGLGDSSNDRCNGGNVFQKPQPVAGLDFADSISMSESHSFFLNHGEEQDIVYVTGLNEFGELGNSSLDSVSRPQPLFEYSDERERTTTMPPPTAAPTPGPGPTSAPGPTPDPTRTPEGDTTPWPLIIMGGGISIAVIVLLVVLARGGNDEPQADGGPADGQQEDLEMIRGQMSMN